MADYFAEKEIDFLGVKEAESRDDTGGWTLKIFDALNQRDITPFRYGMLGVSDVSLTTAYAIIGVFGVVLCAACLYLLNTGKGMRS